MREVWVLVTVMLLGVTLMAAPQYDANPYVIELDVPVEDEGVGGIIAADLTGDGGMDFVVTKPGVVTAAAHDGKTRGVHRATPRRRPHHA